MSENVQLALVAVVVTLVNAVMALVTLVVKEWLDERREVRARESEARLAAELASTNKRTSDELAAGIDVVHKATNSMKDELVEEVRKASYAKGLKDSTKPER